MRLRWAHHVARMKYSMKAFKILVENLLVKGYKEDLDINVRMDPTEIGIESLN